MHIRGTERKAVEHRLNLAEAARYLTHIGRHSTKGQSREHRDRGTPPPRPSA